MLVRDLVPLFLEHCRQNTSPATLRYYVSRIAWFLAAFRDREFLGISKAELLTALAAANKFPDGRPKANDTIRGNTIAFERLQAWGIEAELVEVPITAAKIKKPPGRKRDTLPAKEETARLLNAAAEDFRIIYCALRLTGARPGELCRARIEDIDRTAGEIILAEHKTAKKTGKPRRIALGHSSLQPLLDRSIGDRTSGPIFRDRQGRAWTTERVSAAFRRARKKAGLRKDLVLYLTRHEFATGVYRQLRDIKAVADLLGHSQIGTTMRYTRVESETLRRNAQAFDDSLPSVDPLADAA